MTTKRWLGSAASVFDLWTVTVSGTVVSQTYTLTINSKTVTYVAGVSDTASTILSGLATNWAASTNPEFIELTAVALPAGGPYTSMTLTQNVSGRPSTITASTSGAATFSIAHTTSATGPSFFDNGQNWSGGSAPANSDTLIFDNGSVNCSYNINTSLTGLTINVNTGYSGNIGLPLINATGTTTYAEYRTTYLTIAGGTVVVNAPSCQQCNLAFGSNTSTVRVLNNGSRISPQIPVVLITGGNGSSVLDITKGDVGLGFYGESYNFPTIAIGYVSNATTDVTLYCGYNGTLGTLTKNGGTATVSSNITTVTQDVAGGTVTLTDSVTATTINSYNGNVNINTIGTIGTINLYAASSIVFDLDPRGKTITNPIQVFSSSVNITNNAKTVNSGTLSLALNGSTSVGLKNGGISTLVVT